MIEGYQPRLTRTQRPILARHHPRLGERERREAGLRRRTPGSSIRAAVTLFYDPRRPSVAGERQRLGWSIGRTTHEPTASVVPTDRRTTNGSETTV